MMQKLAKKNSYSEFTFSNQKGDIDEKLQITPGAKIDGTLKTKYYGDDKTKPSEVVGEVHRNDFGTKKEFKAVFGGTKQN